MGALVASLLEDVGMAIHSVPGDSTAGKQGASLRCLRQTQHSNENHSL